MLVSQYTSDLADSARLWAQRLQYVAPYVTPARIQRELREVADLLERLANRLMESRI